jgi:hypothetical protein
MPDIDPVNPPSVAVTACNVTVAFAIVGFQ